MECVECFDSVVGAQFGKEADGLRGVGEHCDLVGVEELLDGGGGCCVVRFDRTDQEFAEDEEAAAEGIGPLQHCLVNWLNAISVFAVALKPVGVEHRVPVDTPHLSQLSDSRAWKASAAPAGGVAGG